MLKQLIILFFIFLTCCQDYESSKSNKESLNTNSKQKSDLPKNIIINYSKDSSYFEIVYNEKVQYKDVNWASFARYKTSKSIIYEYDKSSNTFYFFNYNEGINAIVLNKNQVKNKKIPYHYDNCLRLRGNKLTHKNNKIIFKNLLFAIVYDKALNELFYPYDSIISYKNNKYEDILEARYSIKKDSLKAYIRFLENMEIEKDTIFRFKL